jgi:hypothetical protein
MAVSAGGRATSTAKGRAKGALFSPCVPAEEHLALEKDALPSVLQRWWLGEVASELFKLSIYKAPTLILSQAP